MYQIITLYQQLLTQILKLAAKIKYFSSNWKALENENVLNGGQFFLGEKRKNLSSPKKTIDKHISEL